MEKLILRIGTLSDETLKYVIDNWQTIESTAVRGLIEVADALFSPRQVVKQLVIATLIQSSIMGSRGIVRILNSIYRRFSERGRKRRQLQDAMANSLDYDEWKVYAERLDRLDGTDKWRQEEECKLYNVDVMKKRINDIKYMLSQGDVFDMMFRLRSGLARDQYGTLNIGLFTKATAGTKVIIEEYHETG